MKLRLYHYWRSSCSWRVRWAFTLKGIACEFREVSLLDGESEGAEHRARNPLGFVPVLENLESGAHPRFLGESLAIIEWAEETHPSPTLLPGDAWQRARIRQLAEMINAGTQPIQNPNVAEFHSTENFEKKRWNQHWIRNGLQSYESLVKETAGKFSVGDQVTLADLCLIPQCYNAERFEVPLSDFPTIARINANALSTEACGLSHPSRFQPETST